MWPALTSMMWFVRSCPLMSCPILSSAMPVSPDLSYLVFLLMSVSYSYSFCWCCFHISLLSLCLTVSSSLNLSSSFYLSSSFCSTNGRGLTFTSARVLVSSTCRQSKLAYRHKGLHFACSPCSRAHCVSRQWAGQSPDARTCSRTSIWPTTEWPVAHSAGPGKPQVTRLPRPCSGLSESVFCLHPVLWGVQCPNCSLPVCRVPAATLCADGSARFSNEHCTYFASSSNAKCLEFQRPRCMPCGRQQLAL